MTRDEFAKIVTAMKAVYTDPKFLPDKYAIGVWYGFLKDIGNAECQAAVSEYIATHKFPPTIAEIRELVLKHTQQGEEMSISSLQAWNLVRRALSNGYYGAEEEFSKLPDAVQRTIGSPANIREMSLMDTDAVERVEKGRFIHAYEATVQRIKDEEKIPPSIRTLIQKVTEKTAIGTDEPTARIEAS